MGAAREENESKQASVPVERVRNVTRSMNSNKEERTTATTTATATTTTAKVAMERSEQWFVTT